MVAANARGSEGKLSSETGLRFYQVLDDHMDPTIRRRDYVLLAPVDRYAGEGYYLVSNAFNEPASFSCSAAGTRAKPEVLLHCHNELYPGRTISKAEFDERVLGKIAMICHVVHHDLIPPAWGNAARSKASA